jgi:hypothetical protein
MSIDVTPELLTIRPETLRRDVASRAHADQSRLTSRLDRVMNRLMTSRSTWLAPVLIVQGVLSLRPSRALADSETSSISAGHQLIAHLLHGTPIPNLGHDFSGVPAVYAVPAALLGDIGGPTLVGLACAALAMVATGFIYFTTRRLFGQGPALIAGAILALNGSTLFIARFASADALCVALLAAGAWLAVTSVDRPNRAIALGPCLVLAIAASYLALAFIPATIALLALGAARGAGARYAVRSVGLALGSLAISGYLAVSIVAPGDLRDLRADLLDKQVMTAAATAAVHHQLWTDIGPLLVAGLLAVTVATRNRLVAALLVVTALVPVALQTYLGTASPAHDNAELAVIFLAPIVGVTGMALLRRGRLLGLRVPLAIVGMALLLTSGLVTANHTLRDVSNRSYVAGVTPAHGHSFHAKITESGSDRVDSTGPLR